MSKNIHVIRLVDTTHYTIGSNKRMLYVQVKGLFFWRYVSVFDEKLEEFRLLQYHKPGNDISEDEEKSFLNKAIEVISGNQFKHNIIVIHQKLVIEDRNFSN